MNLIDLFKHSFLKEVNKPESYEQWCQRLRKEYAELTQSPNLNPFDSQAETVYSNLAIQNERDKQQREDDLMSFRIRNREDSAHDRHWVDQRADGVNEPEERD